MKIFEQWFPLFSQGDETENRERLFEYFHSGYLAGTRHGKRAEPKRSTADSGSLAIDDVNRNTDI